MNKLPVIFFTLLWFNVQGLNINIIQGLSNGNTLPHYIWEDVASDMGHNAQLQPKSFLDNMANLTNTDILIISSASDATIYDSVRIANIVQYLQQGGKVYLQSEFEHTYPGNIAYQTITNALGSYFEWNTTSTSGFLNPIQVVGSIASDSTTTLPITQSFWWGNVPECDDGMEHFLEYNSEYYGFIYCVPGSSGRIITMSDQDLIQNFFDSDVDSLLRNIITNLSKSNYDCDLTEVLCKPASAQATSEFIFSIYPQPVSQTLKIALNNSSDPHSMEIYDIHGKKIYNSLFEPEIDISQLLTGMYLLKLYSWNGTAVIKFLKD